MPRYQKNRSSARKMHDKTNERKRTAIVNPKLSPKHSQATCEVTISKLADYEGAVEVIHWVPASTGSVIQIPGGQASEHFNIQIHENGETLEVPIFHTDTVC